MPAPGVASWDGNPNTDPPITAGYRPGSADFNGATLVNDGDAPPPDPTTMPTAELLNTMSLMLVAMGKVVANTLISVKYAAGNPALDSFSAAPSAPVSGTFTVARTGGGAGAGDISVTWPASTFPTAVVKPTVSLNGTTPGMVSVAPITNGVRVVTWDKTGAATDIAFTVALY